MWLILQHDTPEDFVIATGEYHTVRDFTTLAFNETGVELRWEGEGVNEKGIDTKTGKVLVEVDPKYFRPAEVEQLLGDPTKAKTLLGWNPRKTSFEELVKIMVTHDMAFVKKLYMRHKWMVKTLPRHAENENEKMVPAPTTAWLQHGSAGPIFHGQHRTAEHPDSRYAGDRYFYGGRQLSSERHDTV